MAIETPSGRRLTLPDFVTTQPLVAKTTMTIAAPSAIGFRVCHAPILRNAVFTLEYIEDLPMMRFPRTRRTRRFIVPLGSDPD